MDIYLEFIGNEKRPSNVLTQARIQPRLEKLCFAPGHINGKEMWPGIYVRKTQRYNYKATIFAWLEIWTKHFY